MPKRQNEGAVARSMRPRVVHEAPTSESINTARQLMQLLAFEQNLVKARHGLQSFKVFLDGLNDAEEQDPGQLAILKEFLESQRPRAGGDDSEEAIWLPDIMDTWSFAAQTNNDNILSAVPVVLALLVKILSQNLDFSAHGLGICRTILQKRQQELIAKNLAAEKNKEFIISPTLRLLREALCFDGGVLAKQIFRARSSTYKALARNMGIKYLGEGLEEIMRPSARTTSIRFFMSSLKFLHSEAKTELLSQRELVVALTRTIKDDPPYLILEVLEGLKKSVLADRKIPRGAKSKLLNPAALHRIASLYSYGHEAAEEANATPVKDAAHQFLMNVCTTHSAGILRDSGLYHKGVEPDGNNTLDTDEVEEHSDDDSEFGTIPWLAETDDEIPIQNTILADFIKQLKPWSNIRHSELLIAIFDAAPELLAWYFRDKSTFSFEPKLSATWVGYAALLFNSVQLEIPAFFGHKLAYARIPPPTSILLDTIIPPPLTQKVLTRCLTQKSNLISFFAMRLLVVSMEKLRQALKLHQEAQGKNPALWKESAARLLDEFSQRCPTVKDIMNAYRAIPEDDLLYRGAATKALRLYHEVIPRVAFAAKVDISPLLTASLKSLGDEGDDAGGDAHALKMIELENLLAIGAISIGVRWFSKVDGKEVTISPFISLLSICVRSDGLSISGLRNNLNSIAVNAQLVSRKTGLAALFDSLQALHESNQLGSSHPVWPFLENCASRCASSVIKYLEMMEELKLEVSGSPSVEDFLNPLTMAMVEQLPHAIKGADEATLRSLSSFLDLYLAYSKQMNVEPTNLLAKVLDKVRSEFPKGSKARAEFKKKRDLHLSQTAPEENSEQVNGSGVTSKSKPIMDQDTLTSTLATPFPTENNSALSKWATKSVDELLDDNHAAALILLLSSPHTSIRKEALTNILKLAAKFQASTYDEKEQIWLLLSELAESAKQHTADTPLPAHITSFAVHALDVLKNPLHALYVKLNTFLCSGPVWHLDKIPLAHDVLRAEPTEPDAFYSELSWLLTYLLDSLRTPEALTLFHNKRLFGQVMQLGDNPHMRKPLRMLVLKLLYRASEIEGGSATLITRFGVLQWLRGQRDEEDEGIYDALKERLIATSDPQRIEGFGRQEDE